MSKPIDDVNIKLENVIFNVEVVSRQIKDLRILTIDIIAKIEKYQQEIKKIDRITEEKINNKPKGWFY